MSVWDSLVGQKPVIDMLSRIAQGDPSQITQSWLICGPPGSGRSNMARAFAAALESPDHGMSAEPTRVTQQVLAGTHPDVTVLTTNKVTIGIDQVREIITTSEQMPATAPWRIIIIEDVDRMLERTTNVLLKEIEEPAEHCIWLLCAPSAQDVLPTIRSRTRIVNLAVPSTQAVAGFLTSTTNVEPKVAQRAARLAEGHIGIAKLYATNERVMSDRDAPSDRTPPKLRGAFNQIAKKDDVKRLVTRRTRDVLDRALNSIASIYRDVAVLQNNAEDSVGLINLENRSSITELSVRLNRSGAVTRLDEVAHARKRLAGNGNPLLVFESLFCALIS